MKAVMRFELAEDYDRARFMATKRDIMAKTCLRFKRAHKYVDEPRATINAARFAAI